MPARGGTMIYDLDADHEFVLFVCLGIHRDGWMSPL